MKKILFLIPSLVGGGAERVMVTLANGLSKEYDVEILTLTSTNSFYEVADRVKLDSIGCKTDKSNVVTKILSKLKSAVKGFLGIKKAIKEKSPDVMISFLNAASFPLVLLRTFCKLPCKIIVSERADPNERPPFVKWFERTFFSYADVIVCQGKNAAEFFKERDKNKIVVIPNPICASAIPAIHSGERSKRIVGVGRLSEQKNFSLLINAFSKLGDNYSDYKLEIYGAGPLESELNRQIGELGLKDRAFLMGAKKNVMFEIADASLYVMSSNFEGFPNALVEAMATGLPVISTDFPTGIAREVVKEENGIVVPLRDEEALVKAMEELLFDESRRAFMSIENRKYLDILKEETVFEMWKELFC